jgi:hypothetical protein
MNKARIRLGRMRSVEALRLKRTGWFVVDMVAIRLDYVVSLSIGKKALVVINLASRNVQHASMEAFEATKRAFSCKRMLPNCFAKRLSIAYYESQLPRPFADGREKLAQIKLDSRLRVATRAAITA